MSQEKPQAGYTPPGIKPPENAQTIPDRVQAEHCAVWPTDEEIEAHARRTHSYADAPVFTRGARWLRANVKLRSFEDVRAEAFQAGREKRDYEMHVLEEERHELRAQNKVLREALGYYGFKIVADSMNTGHTEITTETGRIAREALAFAEGKG